jgi:hypothetical protein
MSFQRVEDMQNIEFAKLLKVHDDYAQWLVAGNPLANEAITKEIFLAQDINNHLMELGARASEYRTLQLQHWGLVSSIIHALFVQFHGFGFYSLGFIRKAIEFLAIYSLTASNPRIGIVWVTCLKGRREEDIQDWEKEAVASLKKEHGIEESEYRRFSNMLEHPMVGEGKAALKEILVQCPALTGTLSRIMPLSEDKNECEHTVYKIACSLAVHSGAEGMKFHIQETEYGLEFQPFPPPHEQHFLEQIAMVAADFHDMSVCVVRLANQFVDGSEYPEEKLLDAVKYVNSFIESLRK